MIVVLAMLIIIAGTAAYLSILVACMLAGELYDRLRYRRRTRTPAAAKRLSEQVERYLQERSR